MGKRDDNRMCACAHSPTNDGENPSPSTIFGFSPPLRTGFETKTGRNTPVQSFTASTPTFKPAKSGHEQLLPGGIGPRLSPQQPHSGQIRWRSRFAMLPTSTDMPAPALLRMTEILNVRRASASRRPSEAILGYGLTRQIASLPDWAGRPPAAAAPPVVTTLHGESHTAVEGGRAC